MIAAIISLIMALVSYFGSKKAGASDGAAAAIAAGAGLGSYYVATNTEWGKGIVDNVGGWVGLKDEAGNPVTNSDSSPVQAPPGAVPQRNPDGSVKYDSAGNALWQVADKAGNVLTSWGPMGTAAVIGTAGLVSNADEFPWLWVALGVGAFALIS